MAAFALENANKAWQRVQGALDAAGASPEVQLQFRALKMWLATQKGNPNLQFLSFTAAQAAAAGGTVLATGVANVYAVFVKKTATATRNTVKLYDDATDDTTAGDAVIAADLIAASQQAAVIYPDGYALAVGAVITGHTTLIGTTDGSSANAGSGFVLVG
jgi:hypothetical protein